MTDMSIDASRLEVVLQEGERWRRTLNVTVPADLVSHERKRIAKQHASRIKLPGFRKGKIPTAILEKQFGPSLDKELLDSVINTAFREGIKREELRPISEAEVGDVKFEPNQPDQDVMFAISFDVQPTIELSRLGGFSVERPDAEAGSDAVDRVIGRFQEQHGDWRLQEAVKPTDHNLVDVEILRLGEGEENVEPQPYEFVLGKGDALPDIEEAIKTLEPGESGEFVVRFPEDFTDEARRGEEQHIKLTLTSIKVLEPAELTDDFARVVGDFENLQALRDRVAEDLAKEAEEKAENAVRGQLLDSLVEANPFTVPQSMVDRYVDSLLGSPEGVAAEKLKEARTHLGPQAERAVKHFLAIEQVARTEGLQASEAEIDERVEAIAEANDQTPAQVYANLQKAERLEAIEREILESKVFEFLKAQSNIE